ncbi:MAG: site-specific integrase [Flavobacteriaceae bacterium]|jgi:integrase|nr:site-specific integrase [Flavobacteriaceae bacterium]
MAKLKFIYEYEKLIAGMENKSVLTPDGDYYKEETIRVWKSKIGIFSDYQKHLNRKIRLADIDFGWTEKFHLYLLSENYAKNSISNINSTLKAFLRRMYRAGKMRYNGDGIRCQNEITTAVFSDISDLRKLYHHDFSKTAGYARVRDVYICQCFLGLRVSDMMSFISDLKLHTKNINDKTFFEIKTRKTGEVVVIPAADVVLEIAERRNFDFGKSFSRSYYEREISKVVAIAGIDKDILFHRTEGGKVVERVVKYSDLICTHTARRTFATNAYLSGLNPLDIMKITGHKTFNSFIRYIRCENMNVALKISDHEFFKTRL